MGRSLEPRSLRTAWETEPRSHLRRIITVFSQWAENIVKSTVLDQSEQALGPLEFFSLSKITLSYKDANSTTLRSEGDFKVF